MLLVLGGGNLLLIRAQTDDRLQAAADAASQRLAAAVPQALATQERRVQAAVLVRLDGPNVVSLATQERRVQAAVRRLVGIVPPALYAFDLDTVRAALAAELEEPALASLGVADGAGVFQAGYTRGADGEKQALKTMPAATTQDVHELRQAKEVVGALRLWRDRDVLRQDLQALLDAELRNRDVAGVTINTPLGEITVGSLPDFAARSTVTNGAVTVITVTDPGRTSAELRQRVVELAIILAAINLALLGAMWFILRSVVLVPVQVMIARLRHGSERLVGDAAALRSASGRIADEAIAQSGTINEMTLAVSSFADQTRINRDAARSADHEAGGMAAAAVRGEESMGHAGNAVDALRGASERTLTIIEALQEIALQTRILAVNATIEAARAGEAGRGFRVLAREVGALARRSSEANRTAVRLLQDSRDRAGQVATTARTLAKELDQLGGGARHTAELVAAVASASSSQATTLDEFVAATDDMAKRNSQVSDHATRIATASGGLEQAARDLDAVIGDLTRLVEGGVTA